MHTSVSHRAALVSLSVPHGTRTVTHRLPLHSPRPLSSRVADLVRSFAGSRGVSPLAVEYEVSYGR